MPATLDAADMFASDPGRPEYSRANQRVSGLQMSINMGSV